MGERCGDEAAGRLDAAADGGRAEQVGGLHREGELLARAIAAVRGDDLRLHAVGHELLDLEAVAADGRLGARDPQLQRIPPREGVVGDADLGLGAAPLRELRRQGLVVAAVGAREAELHGEGLRHREVRASDDRPHHDLAARAVDAAVGVEECLVALPQIRPAARGELGVVQRGFVEDDQARVGVLRRRDCVGGAVARPLDAREVRDPALVCRARQNPLVGAGEHRDPGAGDRRGRREGADPDEQARLRPLDRQAQVGDDDHLLVVVPRVLGVAGRGEEDAVSGAAQQLPQVEALDVELVALAVDGQRVLDHGAAEVLGEAPTVVAAPPPRQVAHVVDNVVRVDLLERQLDLRHVHALQRQDHGALGREVDAARLKAQQRRAVGHRDRADRVLLQEATIDPGKTPQELHPMPLARHERADEPEPAIAGGEPEVDLRLDLDELRRGPGVDPLGAVDAEIDVVGRLGVGLEVADAEARLDLQADDAVVGEAKRAAHALEPLGEADGEPLPVVWPRDDPDLAARCAAADAIPQRVVPGVAQREALPRFLGPHLVVEGKGQQHLGTGRAAGLPHARKLQTRGVELEEPVARERVAEQAGEAARDGHRVGRRKAQLLLGLERYRPGILPQRAPSHGWENVEQAVRDRRAGVRAHDHWLVEPQRDHGASGRHALRMEGLDVQPVTSTLDGRHDSPQPRDVDGGEQRRNPEPPLAEEPGHAAPFLRAARRRGSQRQLHS